MYTRLSIGITQLVYIQMLFHCFDLTLLWSFLGIVLVAQWLHMFLFSNSSKMMVAMWKRERISRFSSEYFKICFRSRWDFINAKRKEVAISVTRRENEVGQPSRGMASLLELLWVERRKLCLRKWRPSSFGHSTVNLIEPLNCDEPIRCFLFSCFHKHSF